MAVRLIGSLGIPAGGVPGQVLSKAGAENFTAAWIDPPAGEGSVGPAGPAGPVGPQGTEGAGGAQGPTGLTGPAGNTGPQGVAGQTGPAGAKGDQGAAGVAGAAGTAGPQGIQGATGPTGPQGAAGDTGVKRLYWTGTAWPTLPTDLPAGTVVEWDSLNDSTAPTPPEAVIGHRWLQKVAA